MSDFLTMLYYNENEKIWKKKERDFELNVTYLTEATKF